MKYTLSFRARILFIVSGVAVVPLALMGIWLGGSAARSGEELLVTRLEETLVSSASAIEDAWVGYRSTLLDYAESNEIQGVLRADSLAPRFDDLDMSSLEPSVLSITLRDTNGVELLRLDRPDSVVVDFGFGAPLSAELPLFDVATGQSLGALAVELPLLALRQHEPATTVAGAVLTGFDPQTGALLLPVPFDATLLNDHRFEWNGEDWRAMRRAIVEPRVDLVAAAPLEPFAGPFREAARNGMLAFLGLAALGLLLASVLTTRLTSSLESLATATEAVAAGDLARQVDTGGSAEVGRLAQSFNAMTRSLRRTLSQLAERESLIAVNEFAAALAHEVRNPLSAIQLALQEVEEQLPPDSPLRSVQAQVLDDVRRLERTVAGALDTARSGHIQSSVIDLRAPLEAAIRAATPHFRERGAELRKMSASQSAISVHADTDALQRVFLNLLLNAAASLPKGGSTNVYVEEEAERVSVHIEDSGEGIPASALSQIFEPFYSTRAGGTGIGLSVARRIITAHGGEIQISSEEGKGTHVEVRLPRSGPEYQVHSVPGGDRDVG